MDSKSLSIGIYEHFKEFPRTRGIGIITDKQFVFYTQYDKSDGFNHDSALIYLDKKIYPFKNYTNFYQNSKDVTFCVDIEVYIDIQRLPISNTQLQLLEYIVDEIGKFNNEVSNKDKISIIVFWASNFVENTDVNIIKQALQTLPIRNEIEEIEEVIIGKTIADINSSEIKNNL